MVEICRIQIVRKQNPNRVGINYGHNISWVFGQIQTVVFEGIHGKNEYDNRDSGTNNVAGYQNFINFVALFEICNSVGRAGDNRGNQRIIKYG